MKIQEALSKVKELKADALTLLSEAHSKKEKVIYLDVESNYASPRSETAEVDLLLDDALSKLARAHDLKVAIQKSNSLVGVIDLIQEKDFLKMLCTGLEPLRRIQQESDPSLANTFASTSEPVFVKKKAAFNTEDVANLYNKAVERIREIEIELQRKNWEVDIDEVLTNKCMDLLNEIG